MKQHWGGATFTFIDVLLCLWLTAVCIAAAVQPPATPNTSGDKPICSIAIDISWPDSYASDVDLWGKAGNTKAVGYSSRDGDFLSLVRDDLGKLRNESGTHFERICGRGFIEGEYIFNVHAYSNPPNTAFPLPVKVTVSLVDPSSAFMKEIWNGQVELKHLGEEVTAVRFRLDQHGRLASGSINDIPVKLRSR